MSAAPARPCQRTTQPRRPRIIHGGLFIMVLLLGAPFAHGADELEDRQRIGAQASTLFMQERFAELEQLADQYRTTEARTRSGLWKLTLFYSGITDVAFSDDKSDKYWNSIESRALRWVGAFPDSPAPRITYSLILIGHAWMFRGSAWGSEVKPQDWKPFHEYMKKAETYLLEHKDIAATDPRWYETMLAVARAQDWEIQRFKQLVDEAVARYPYFYPIYFAAVDYLTPKWHGSREQIEAFADFAVGKTAEREGTGMYARIYWYAAQAQYRDRLFTDSSVVWGKMKKSIGDVLQRYPDQWNINNFAHFACLAWDRDETRELMGRIEGAPIPRAWKDEAQYRQCRTWAFADVSGQGPAPVPTPVSPPGS